MSLEKFTGSGLLENLCLGLRFFLVGLCRRCICRGFLRFFFGEGFVLEVVDMVDELDMIFVVEKFIV